MFISVIIPTRNRAASLGRALETLGRVICPKELPWEVIVVDNDSTDETKAVVESFMENSDLDVHYLLEPERGTSNARNAGAQAARGELLAFIDDDILVSPDWLAQIAAEASRDPSVSLFFGQTRVAKPGQAKIALSDGDTEVTYAFPCNPCEPGASNNMVARKAALLSVSGFDRTLGPGTPLRAAEDADFTYRVLRTGGIVRYCPTILVLHDHDRLSPAAVRSLLFDYGKGRGGFYCKHVLRSDRYAAKLCYWELSWFLRSAFRRDQVSRAIPHLSGLATGIFFRLTVELRALLKPRLRVSEPPREHPPLNRAQ